MVCISFFTAWQILFFPDLLIILLYAAPFRVKKSPTHPEVVFPNVKVFCFLSMHCNSFQIHNEPQACTQRSFQLQSTKSGGLCVYPHTTSESFVWRLSIVHSCICRALLSRRHCVSSVFPPSRTGRLSVSARASYLTTTRREILGCCRNWSVSRPMLRRWAAL
jgi:hypothetical protein